MEKYNIMFIHGYESSGEGFKGQYLKSVIPSIKTPTFRGELQERLDQLWPMIEQEENWILIGSSFGGLMATLTAGKYPERIKKLLLFAPALISPYFQPEDLKRKLTLPTIIYLGKNDTIIPLQQISSIIERIFPQKELHITDDNHFLRKTVKIVPWNSFLA